MTIKIVMRVMDKSTICEFKELTEGTLALLQLLTMFAALAKGTVIAIMDRTLCLNLQEKALKDDALGSYVHLGSLLIIKNYNSFPSQRK